MPTERYPAGRLPVVKLTTTSGYTWETEIAAGMSEQDARDYFVGDYFNVTKYPLDTKYEKVVDLVFTPATCITDENGYLVANIT